MGTSAFRKFQYGKESTHGTAVAATKMLPVALGPIKPDRKPVIPRESAGVKADGVRSYLSGLLVKDTLKFDNLYFECLPMLFSAGVKGGVSAVEQNAGQHDYLWAFGPSLKASNAQESLTIERGDDEFAVETEYVMFQRIKISGQVNQDGGSSILTAEADYFGRQNTSTSFTSLNPQENLTAADASLTKFYLDGDWAGVGSTERANILRGFDFEILTGLHPKFHGSGAQYFDTHGEGSMGVMASFVFEGSSFMTTLLTAFNLGTQIVIRLEVLGPQIGSGEYNTLQLDVNGVLESLIPLSAESSGNDLWAAVLRGYAKNAADPSNPKLFDVNVITDTNSI